MIRQTRAVPHPVHPAPGVANLAAPRRRPAGVARVLLGGISGARERTAIFRHLTSAAGTSTTPLPGGLDALPLHREGLLRSLP